MNEEQERRRKTRVGYHGRAEVWVEGEKLSEVVLRDISIKGLFAETDQKAEKGQSCEVVILLEPLEDQTIRIQGRIYRLEPGGFAIRFQEIDPESYAHLRNIVLYNAESPDQVEAELSHPGIR